MSQDKAPAEVPVPAVAEHGRAGRVRLVTETEEPEDANGSATTVAARSWSPQAILFGVVALLVMIGALVVILWGVFQSV